MMSWFNNFYSYDWYDHNYTSQLNLEHVPLFVGFDPTHLVGFYNDYDHWSPRIWWGLLEMLNQNSTEGAVLFEILLVKLNYTLVSHT